MNNILIISPICVYFEFQELRQVGMCNPRWLNRNSSYFWYFQVCFLSKSIFLFSKKNKKCHVNPLVLCKSGQFEGWFPWFCVRSPKLLCWEMLLQIVYHMWLVWEKRVCRFWLVWWCFRLVRLGAGFRQRGCGWSSGKRSPTLQWSSFLHFAGNVDEFRGISQPFDGALTRVICPFHIFHCFSLNSSYFFCFLRKGSGIIPAGVS